MTKSSFIQKFNLKTNDELEAIASNAKVYVLEARHVAATILKSRNISLPIIDKIEREVNKVSEQFDKQEKIDEIIEQRQRDRLISFESGKTYSFKLENGNKLIIKRLSETKYSASLDGSYLNFLLPILICSLKGNKKTNYFPFFNISTLLLWGLGGGAVFILLSLLNQIDYSFQLVIMPLAFIGAIQIITMPILYFALKNQLKNALGIKRVLTSHKK